MSNGERVMQAACHTAFVLAGAGSRRMPLPASSGSLHNYPNARESRGFEQRMSANAKLTLRGTIAALFCKIERVLGISRNRPGRFT
jgi:hypothetical protein